MSCFIFLSNAMTFCCACNSAFLCWSPSRPTLSNANTLDVPLLGNKLTGSVVESNYHISSAAVELSLVMRIVPTVDQLEVERPT